MESAPVVITECALDRARPPDESTRTAGPVIGIDLGTRNCRVAIMRGEKPECCQWPGGRAAGRAVVAATRRGRIVVGEEAAAQCAAEAALGVWDVKTMLTASWRKKPGAALRESLRCPLFDGPRGQPGARLGNREFSARELAALVVAAARELAQDALGEPVSRAVFATTSPGDGEWARGVCALAGLHLVRVIPDALAAWQSIERPAKKPKPNSALVCDWGASGVRASLLVAERGDIQTAVVVGDSSLNGRAIDGLVAEAIGSEVLNGLEATASLRAMNAIERVKEALVDQPEAVVRVPFVVDATGVARDMELRLERSKYDDLTAPLVERVLHLCESALERRGMFPGDVEEVIFAGEASRVPLLRERAVGFFPGVALRLERSGDLAALGAAIVGSREP